MMEFEPGDRVSFINDDYNGTVSSIIDENNVNVELDDGLEIPVSINEIVKAGNFTKSEEAKSRRIGVKAEQEEKVTRPVEANRKGFFLAYFFEGNNDEKLTLELLNFTEFPILCTFYEEGIGSYQSLFGGRLEIGELKKIKTLNLSDFENWRPLHIQVLEVRKNSPKLKEPLYLQFRARAGGFFKAKRMNFLDNRNAYVFPLVGKLPELEQVANREEWTSPIPELKEIERPDRLVDLHLEKIIDVKKYKANEEMALDIQMQYFEKNLEKAIALKYPKIVFIHGLGAGVLKNKIYSYLEKLPSVLNYGAADIKKYGQGAIEIFIKP